MKRSIIFFFLSFASTGCSSDIFASSDDAADLGDAQGDVLVEGDGPQAGDAIASDAAVGDSADSSTVNDAPYRRVFITDGTFRPDQVGGAVGADGLCNAAAKKAVLGGTWVAWLSTKNSNVADRTTHAVVPYVLVDKTTIVATNWETLTTTTLQNPIDHNEYGVQMAFDISGGGHVWTSSYQNGMYFYDSSQNQCDDMTTSNTSTAAVGYSNVGGTAAGCWSYCAEWTCGSGNPNENNSLSLYCVEQ
jgi:hypothetical protein